jgi:hypothetical protein
MSDTIKQKKANSFPAAIRLVERLFSKDGIQRRNARKQLEKCGGYVTPFLIGVLKSKNVDARWEAAKALITLKDPLAADALADALMDEDFEIRWLAAEALIALGRDAVEPLLRKLLSHYDSAFLRIGAHHVMKLLKTDESLKEETVEILDELCAIVPLEPYPLAARNALESLIHKKKNQAPTEHKTTHVSKG